MTLPISRDLDAVDSGPLPHTTLNNLQDMVIGGRHGAIRVIVPASFGTPGSGSGAAPSFTSVSIPGTDEWILPLDLRVGHTIEDIFIESSNLVAADIINFQLYNGEVAVAGTVGATTAAGGPNRDAVPGIASIVVGIGDAYAMLLIADVGNTFAITLKSIDYEITG